MQHDAGVAEWLPSLVDHFSGDARRAFRVALRLPAVRLHLDHALMLRDNTECSQRHEAIRYFSRNLTRAHAVAEDLVVPSVLDVLVLRQVVVEPHGRELARLPAGVDEGKALRVRLPGDRLHAALCDGAADACE